MKKLRLRLDRGGIDPSKLERGTLLFSDPSLGAAIRAEPVDAHQVDVSISPMDFARVAKRNVLEPILRSLSGDKVTTPAWVQEVERAATELGLGRDELRAAVERAMKDETLDVPAELYFRDEPDPEAGEPGPKLHLKEATRGPSPHAYIMQSFAVWFGRRDPPVLTSTTEYGWPREPGAPCKKIEGLPRACTERQCMADPKLLEHELVRAFDRLASKRVCSWHLALNDAQKAHIRRTLEWRDPRSIVLYLGMLLPVLSRPTARQVQREFLERFEQAKDEILPAPGTTGALKYREDDPTDEDFVDRLLNGFCPVRLHDRPGGGFRVHIHTSRFSLDGPYRDGLPDVTIDLARRQDGWVRVEAIELISATGSERHVPAGGTWSGWAHAKRVARMAANLHGQVAWHLARGHLLPEMAHIAALRTLPEGHALFQLLMPHLKGSIEINNLGEDLIVGEHGAIVRCSALSKAGALEFAVQEFGALDWKDFAPREPIARQHHFAHAQLTFWSHLKDFVEKFVRAKHVPDAATAAFCKELVVHAAGARPVPGRGTLRRGERGEIPAPPGAQSRAKNGDGITAALHPIDPDDTGHIIELCTWILHHTLFVHTWVNDGQLLDNGHLIHGPLGMKMRGTPSSEAEFWRDYAPEPEDAALQLLLVEQLTRTRYLELGREDTSLSIPHDVSSHFADRSFRAAMDSLGFHPDRIRARADV